MTSKEIYESIDQSKLSSKGREFLKSVEKNTQGFTKQNDKVDSVLKKLYADLKIKKPEALKDVTVKTVEKEVKVPTTKSERKKEPKKKTKVVKTKVKKATGKKKNTKPTKTPSTPKKGKEEHISTRASKLAKKDGITFKEARAKLSKIAKEQLKKDEKETEKELDKLLKFVRKGVFEDGEKYPKTHGKQDPKSSSVSADAKRKAKPAGRRVSEKSGETTNQYGTFKNKTGRVYYESRDNRSDRNSVKAPKGQYKYKGQAPPYLAEGGAIDSLKKDMNSKLDIHSEYYAKGGEVKEYFNENLEVVKNYVDEYNETAYAIRDKKTLKRYVVDNKANVERNLKARGFSKKDVSRILNNAKTDKSVNFYAKGGEIDLFEDYESQPKELSEIVEVYEERYADGDMDYESTKEFLDKVNAIGYTFDSGLDNEPYNLRPMMAKGGRTISIVNDGVTFDKSKYKAVYGDFDKDGTVNIDDANPLDKTKSGQVEQVELIKTFDKLLGVKAELDEIMYDAVETLDEKAPEGADIYARTKTPYSILKKLVEKRMLDPKRGLTDMIGTTIAVDNQKELEQVRDKIDGGLLGKVLDRDDFYKTPNAGYRAYHYIVEYKGVPVEVQLKTKNMKKLHEVSHEAYKNGTLNAKSLDSLSKTFMRADKGDAKAKSEISKLLKDKKLLASKISKGSMAKGGEIQMSEIYNVNGKDYLFSTPIQNAKGTYTGWDAYEVVYDIKDGEKHLNYTKTKKAKSKYFPNGVKRTEAEDYFAKGGEIDAFIMKFVKDAPASNLRVDSEQLTAKLKRGGKLGKKVAGYRDRMEAGGTLPTPFGQAGLVAETGTMNEVDLFAMGGGLPQGVHQYYANTYNPAYPTPHGYAKGGEVERYGILISDNVFDSDDDSSFQDDTAEVGFKTEKEAYKRKAEILKQKPNANLSVYSYTTPNSMEKGGEVLEYSKILDILTDKIDDSVEDISSTYEQAENSKGEEVESKSRDGFIPFTNGGYSSRWFEYSNILEGSGMNLPTESLDDKIEEFRERNREYGFELFEQEYPEIVKELGGIENVNYSELYDAGYGSEAEELDEFMRDDDDTVMMEVEAFYYTPFNERGENGKHTIQLSGVVNLEAPYHRSGNLEDYIEERFTFDTLKELEDKLDKGLAKVVSWFEGDMYDKNPRELKIRRMEAGGQIPKNIIEAVDSSNNLMEIGKNLRIKGVDYSFDTYDTPMPPAMYKIRLGK